ncbi:MAG: hypothetical protein WAU81_00330, partial [Candidatus Aminicenantales bacterium]
MRIGPDSKFLDFLQKIGWIAAPMCRSLQELFRAGQGLKLGDSISISEFKNLTWIIHEMKSKKFPLPGEIVSQQVIDLGYRVQTMSFLVRSLRPGAFGPLLPLD